MNPGQDMRKWLTGMGVAGMLVFSTAASGQDREALRELKRLHDELCNPQRISSIQEGEAALEKLAAWNRSPSRLSVEHRGRLLRVEIYAALAVGDASRATDRLGELRHLAPGARETLEAAYLVAAVTGDAAGGQAVLKQLDGLTESKERRRLISRRRRWLKRVGGDAPAVEIKTDDGMKWPARERYGVVLVIDFWQSRAMSDEYAGAVKDLYDEYRRQLHVQFIGVNTDSKQSVDEARRIAREAGYTWPQLFEEQAGRAPITHGAFRAGSPPWTVVIDGEGRVRAVGRVTEPALQYALRAAAGEAAGKFASQARPGGRGRRAQARGAEGSAGGSAEGSTGGGAKPAAPPVAKGDLPSNPEAEALLRQARLYVKTGMKRQAKELFKRIIREYPGTRQARDAKERLALLP